MALTRGPVGATHVTSPLDGPLRGRRGSCWIHLGQTQGRGKLDTRREYVKPVKNIFVKPLCPDWKAILNR